MRRVSFSDAEKTISFVWTWYQRAIAAAKNQLLAERAASAVLPVAVFVGMSDDEVAEFFAELDYLTMLDLLAAAEAALRVDFWTRVTQNRKDALSRRFRSFAKHHGRHVRLVEHVLEAWKDVLPETQGTVADFQRALGLRHWLAHGRYWTPRWGQTYAPADVFDICDGLLERTKLSN